MPSLSMRRDPLQWKGSGVRPYPDERAVVVHEETAVSSSWADSGTWHLLEAGGDTTLMTVGCEARAASRPAR